MHIINIFFHPSSLVKKSGEGLKETESKTNNNDNINNNNDNYNRCW